MDALALLKTDHDKVKGIFEEFEGAGDRAYKTKKNLVDKACMELDVHTKIEEEIFYPAVNEAGGSDEQEIVSEGIEEHHVVDVLMQELGQMDPEDEQYDAKFMVLMENVRHHMQEEEGELFPKVRKLMADSLDQLGQRMEKRKNELMAGARA